MDYKEGRSYTKKVYGIIGNLMKGGEAAVYFVIDFSRDWGVWQRREPGVFAVSIGFIGLYFVTKKHRMCSRQEESNGTDK